MKRRTLSLLVALVMAAASCGGSDPVATGGIADTADTDNAEAVEASTEAAEPSEPSSGAQTVAASVTIGDETFTFDVVTCTLGTEVDGQIYGPKVAGGFTADASMGMVVSNDPDVGDRITVTDASFDEALSRFDSTIEFTEVIFDGESFSGTGEFIDKAGDSDVRLPGTVSGTCS